jgi:hypothetical protein
MKNPTNHLLLFRSMLAIFVLTLFSSLGLAYSLKKKSIETIFNESELVIVGKAVTKTNETTDFANAYFTVKVKAVVKGKTVKQVDVWTDLVVSEMKVNCCSIGSDYVFFLIKLNDGRYMSANGRYGVFAIKE